MKEGTIFIVSHGARNRRIPVFERIIDQCPGSDYSQVFYITPAVFTGREVRKQFFSSLKGARKGPGYIPFGSFTLMDLCMNIYGMYGKRAIVSDRIRPLILCDMLGENGIGYSNRLSDMLGKIRHHIPDRELTFVKEEIGTRIFDEKTARRAATALEKLQDYEKKLDEKGLIDFEGALIESIPMIEQYVHPAIAVFDGFFDPTPLELQIIDTLIERSGKVYVLVEESAGFLNHLGSKGDAFETIKITSLHRRKGTGFYHYPSVEDEVEGIARRIKGSILEGVRPTDITVCFPVMSKYIPIARRVFRKHGIPVNISDCDLSSSRPLSALEDLVTSIEDDYPANEFLSFLTSPHFPGIPQTVREWSVSLSYKAGLVKGRASWLSIRDVLISSTEREFPPDMRRILDEFQRQLGQVIDILEGLRQVKSLLSFVDELESILRKYDFFESLKAPVAGSSGYDIAGGIEELLQEFRQVAGITCSGGIDKGAGFYLRQLISGLKGSFGDADGVRIVPFETAAGLESRQLFFGGIIDGDLPSRPPIDPILPENVKRDIGLPFLEYYLDRQKRYFTRLLHSSYDDPCFSCPEADGDNLLLPSPFLDWSAGLAPGAVSIFTEEDIQREKGRGKQRFFSELLWNGGTVSDKDVRGSMLQRFGDTAYFRVTEIDTYRRCPLKFYIEKVLCLEKEEPPRFEVESRLWGKIAHKTMECLFRDGDVQPDMMDKRLFQSVTQALGEFQIGEFWKTVAVEIFRRLLPALKKQETRLQDEGFYPCRTENAVSVVINGLGLRGKIDRVDMRRSHVSSLAGRDKHRTRGYNTVILLDYKTGSADRDSLQLPLYAAMWEKKYADSVERTGYYSLKKGTIEWFPVKQKREDFMNNALKKAEEIAQMIRDGIFPPAPSKKGVCRTCYHVPLCKGAD